MFNTLICKLLVYIASKTSKGKKHPDYPQLWYYMPYKKNHPILRCFLQWLCGIFSGHELSKTEKGYGGGKFADQWCRWCDKMFKVPLQEVDFSSEVKDIITYEFGQDDVT